MRTDKGRLARLFTLGTPECAALCAALGILTALLLLWRGVLVTMLVIFCVAAGVFLGGVKNKREFIRKLIGRDL